MPYSANYSLVNKSIKNDSSAINDEEDSISTSYEAVGKFNQRKSFCPVFNKKSFESDSLLGVMTESGSESLNCDSNIESEANNIADNIFQDNIENFAENNSETFLVSASSDQVVSLNDFAFDNQENFFQMSHDLKIPLDIPKNQLLDIPIKETLTARSSKTFEDLSLIEEVTEHTNSLSTIKSKDVTPRDIIIDDSHEHQLDVTDAQSTISEPFKIHKPKILQKTFSLESPRNINSNVSSRLRVQSEMLPSKSNPATPREDLSHDVYVKEKPPRKSLYSQNKSKIVSKRYQRSPPRETQPQTVIVPKPIQTKTGLVLTQPFKDESLSSSGIGPRSASSASLYNCASPTPLNRQISKSSENIPRLIPQYRKQKYDHVESKVKKYIEESKKKNSKSTPSSCRKNVSRSCSNLQKTPNLNDYEKRPKTADSDSTVSSLLRPDNDESFLKPMRRSISKSETNLKKDKSMYGSSVLSKSTYSIGQIGAIYDSSEEDVTQLTAIHNDDALSNKTGSLLELVAKERNSKQEAKKVINELQTSYDDLLQKYAAAENALDKVRFGIKPSIDSGREEVFTMADKIAEKIASYEIEEKKGMLKKLKKNKNNQHVKSNLKDSIIGISNQVSTYPNYT